jgi:hypothetical protein
VTPDVAGYETAEQHRLVKRVAVFDKISELGELLKTWSSVFSYPPTPPDVGRMCGFRHASGEALSTLLMAGYNSINQRFIIFLQQGTQLLTLHAA